MISSRRRRILFLRARLGWICWNGCWKGFKLESFVYSLDSFEPGILETIQISERSDIQSERIRRIKLLLLQLGIFKFLKNSKCLEMTKSIEGVAGVQSSVQLVYSLAKFVQTSKNIEEKSDSLKVQPVFEELCLRRDELVEKNEKLFPFDFPKIHSFGENEDILARIRSDNELMADQNPFINEFDNPEANTQHSVSLPKPSENTHSLSYYSQVLRELHKKLKQYSGPMETLPSLIPSSKLSSENRVITFPNSLCHKVTALCESDQTCARVSRMIENANLSTKIQFVQAVSVKLSEDLS
eukprot:TRINITY_DN7431_c0_g2_i3.p1 TRINITY_DN7431_c0_g2~~TRINITY_DN7431_c0_g2_i3.p1  ORF type:complete len:298 (-),score=23.75 TRINITY_DN7431_c0_g2_i3:119-1012(-)